MSGVGKERAAVLLILITVFLNTACVGAGANGTEAPPEREAKELKITIDGQELSVVWEDNASVKALAENAPLTVEMSMYGGFEQVGPLGASLPRDDVQLTTQAGDIVLYAGDQIVVFYGSNAWAYTRLGHIADKTAQELAALLGNGDVTVTITTQ